MLNRGSNSTAGISVGIYWRKFFLFAGLFAVSILSFQSFKAFQADSNTSSVSSVNIGYDSNYTSQIVIAKDGSITIDGKKAVNKVAVYDAFDELRMPVIDLPANDIALATFVLTLPKNNAKQVTPEILGIHGVGETSFQIQNDNTIIYQAKNISTYATVSIIAKLPKGTISPPISERLLELIPKFGTIWLVLGLLLPISTLVLMFFILIKGLKNTKPKRSDVQTEFPPMAIPPGVVGVLYRQKVGPREIAATLIDLALRGDILIIDRSRDYGFAKNKLDQRLLGFEKILLSKIFQNNLYSNKAEVDRRINNHVYSKKISILSLGIYNLATRLGYFKKNPQAIYIKYKVWGFATFALGLAGFALSLYKYPSTLFAFVWVGMMISALVIAFMSQKIPVRTEQGEEAYTNWLSFKSFLSNTQKIPYTPENQNIFNKYLPYAIVLDCEVEWAKRFSEHNFVVPSWFVTDKDGLDLADFCLSLFPIVSYVSRSFAAIREPGFR